MLNRNDDDELEGPIHSRKNLFGKKKTIICTSCGEVRDSQNQLHREFMTHQFFKWEVIGRKVLCARCVCALFSGRNYRN